MSIFPSRDRWHTLENICHSFLKASKQMPWECKYNHFKGGYLLTLWMHNHFKFRAAPIVNIPWCLKPPGHYLCTPELGTPDCVISIEIYVNGDAYPVAIGQKVTKNLPVSFYSPTTGRLAAHIVNVQSF